MHANYQRKASRGTARGLRPESVKPRRQQSHDLGLDVRWRWRFLTRTYQTGTSAVSRPTRPRPRRSIIWRQRFQPKPDKLERRQVSLACAICSTRPLERVQRHRYGLHVSPAPIIHSGQLWLGRRSRMDGMDRKSI